MRYEIAANYSHVFVRFMEHALTWLWTRLYDGVEFGHAATLEQVAEGHELIYVPCHRSHMDYLLLSYAIYVQGYRRAAHRRRGESQPAGRSGASCARAGRSSSAARCAGIRCMRPCS